MGTQLQVLLAGDLFRRFRRDPVYREVMVAVREELGALLASNALLLDALKGVYEYQYGGSIQHHPVTDRMKDLERGAAVAIAAAVGRAGLRLRRLAPRDDDPGLWRGADVL